MGKFNAKSTSVPISVWSRVHVGVVPARYPNGSNFSGLNNKPMNIDILWYTLSYFPRLSIKPHKIWNMFVSTSKLWSNCADLQIPSAKDPFFNDGKCSTTIRLLRRDFRCSTKDPKIGTIRVTNDRLSVGPIFGQKKGEVRNCSGGIYGFVIPKNP